MLGQRLAAELSLLKQQGLYRERCLSESLLGGVNFSANDYLSLRNDPRLKQAFQEGYARYSAGSGASMVVCGYHAMHRELEEYCAELLGADQALLFSSGYAANLGVMTLLARLNAHVFVDKAVHASVYDGIQLAKGGYTRFLHNDVDDLQRKLAPHIDAPVIVTEGIFSMSGQQSPLATLQTIAKERQAVLCVDEAHSFGVLGEQGLGAVAYHQLSQEEVPLRILSFGKALGSQGALVVGDAHWIQGLLQMARSHIYSTGISPALAYGMLQGVQLMVEAKARRQKLWDLVAYFQEKVTNSPLSWRISNSPIQQLQLGCPHQALEVAQGLAQRKIYCLPMRVPTVSRRETGLRVVLNYHHEARDIDNLFQTLHNLC